MVAPAAAGFLKSRVHAVDVDDDAGQREADNDRGDAISWSADTA